MRTTHIVASIALLGVLLLAACGGDSEESAPSTTVDLNRLCDLLTQAEVEEHLGEPVEVNAIGGFAPEGDEPVDEPTLGYVGGNCLYMKTEADGSVKNVLVFAWTKGAAFEPGPGAPEDVQTFCDERAGIGVRDPEPEPVDGLGERAFQHDDGGLYVVAGEICLSVFAGIDTSGDPAGDIEEREIELALARLVVGRLPGE